MRPRLGALAPALLLSLAGLAACAGKEEEEESFGSGSWTEDTATDTATDTGGEDTSATGAPVIEASGSACNFFDLPQTSGTGIRCRLQISDTEGDILGGGLALHLTNDAGVDTRIDMTVVSEADVDPTESQAYVSDEDGRVIFDVAPTATDFTWTVALTLTDTAGHVSQEAIFEVAAGSAVE